MSRRNSLDVLQANKTAAETNTKTFAPIGFRPVTTPLNKDTDYAYLTDLKAYQPAGSYALKNDLKAYQPAGSYALKNDLTNFASKTDLKAYQPAGAYALKNDLTGFALKSELPVGQDLSKYASKTDLTGYASKTDLTGYASKTDLTKFQPVGSYALKDDLKAYQPTGNYALKSDIPDVTKFQPVGNYALKSDIPAGQDLSKYALVSHTHADFALKSDLTGLASKTELTKFQPTGNYALKSDIPDVTKFQTIGDYALKSDLKAYQPVGAVTGTVTSTVITDYDAFTKPNTNVNIKGNWNIQPDNIAWDPKIRGEAAGRTGLIYTEDPVSNPNSDASTHLVDYDVPAGMRTAHIMHLPWSNCGYFDIYGRVGSEAEWQFITRVNAFQNTRNDSKLNYHDGAALISIPQVNKYNRIRVQGRKGRIHLMGVGWFKGIVGGASSANGFVNWDNIVGKDDIRLNSIGRDTGDWFRIYGTAGAGTALYNGLSVNDGGGLSVGKWQKIPQGQLNVLGSAGFGGDMPQDWTGVNIKRRGINGGNAGWTHFDWKDDGRNYIRGDTVVDGNTNFNGNVDINGNFTVKGQPVGAVTGGVTGAGSGINFTSKWGGTPDGVQNISEISNDTTVFKKLMVVGNKSSGENIRKVGVWDQLDVHGKLNSDGEFRAVNGYFKAVPDSVQVGANQKNSWILHAPNDDRNTFFVAPGTDGGNWDWSKQMTINKAGDVNVQGNFTVKGQPVGAVTGAGSGINFTSKWGGTPDGVQNISEISNDTNAFKTLMIVGNKSAGQERRVGVWDRLDVNGKLCVQGVCIDGATLASFIKK